MANSQLFKCLEIMKQVEEILASDSVFLVGGSVRDSILNRDIHDFDFATSMSPDEIEARVRDAGRKPYLIGKKFGTIGFKVMANETWNYVEVTAYRSEVYDGSSRKPTVEFTNDLLADLSRRDFTMNAMAMDSSGKLIDPYGGKLDILAKKIKAVGESKKRFNEDPLRMLRAARFASQLGFEVDPNMIGVMRKMGSTIHRVSRERWTDEFDKLLLGDNVRNGLEVLQNSYILKYTLPELFLLFKNDELMTDRVYAIEQAPDVNLKWKKLLEFSGVPFCEIEKDGVKKYPEYEQVAREINVGICHRLKFSNDRKREVRGHV